MILYDGVDIRSVANVRIEDIRVSAIQYAPVARARSIDGGSVFVRNRCGTRTVTVTFAILSEKVSVRQADLAAISAWAKSDKEYKIEIIGHDNSYLTGICTSKPDPSTRQWWESKLRLVFTCYDNPFWTSNEEKSVACGTQFTVFGDAQPLMRIVKRRTSSASNQAYSNGTNTITFSSVPSGDMVINLNQETARVDSTNLMPNYLATSRWIVPNTGTQTITGDGTVIYRERWE